MCIIIVPNSVCSLMQVRNVPFVGVYNAYTLLCTTCLADRCRSQQAVNAQSTPNHSTSHHSGARYHSGHFFHNSAQGLSCQSVHWLSPQQEPPHQPPTAQEQMIFPITPHDVSQQLPPPPTTQAYLDVTLSPCTTQSNYDFLSVREELLTANPPVTTDPNIRQFSDENSFYSTYPGSQQSIENMWTFPDDFLECDGGVQRSSTPTPTHHQSLHVPSLKIPSSQRQNVPSPQVCYTHNIIM